MSDTYQYLYYFLLMHLLVKDVISHSLLSQRNAETDAHGRIQMGALDDHCDNGMDNLTVDWDGNPVNYTCYHPKNPILVDPSIPPVLECDKIPRDYFPMHHCMNDKIDYKSILPTHDDHRPIWPVYGEYQFLPPQRWLHNIEHGAVVLLYHPCANPFVVQKIKGIVKSCLRRHIISKYNLLSQKMPIALVAWGCRYLLNDANTEEVVEFIKNHALRGPEQVSKDGIYNWTLIEKAKIPPGSDYEDSYVCPGH